MRVPRRRGGHRRATDAAARGPLPLELTGVTSGYGAVQVLRQISLHVAAGEAVAILGANGAGKSTLLKTISGHLRPNAGAIHCGDHRLHTMKPHKIARLGVIHVLEGRRIFVEQTVRENLALGAAVRPEASDAVTLEQVLELVPHLADKLDRPASNLSGGEQQMLAISRGALGNPRLLLLDEPSLGLAPKLVDGILDLLLALKARLCFSLVLVEQDAFMAAQLADRVCVMRTGRMTSEYPAEALLGNEELLGDYLPGSDEVPFGRTATSHPG